MLLWSKQHREEGERRYGAPAGEPSMPREPQILNYLKNLCL